MSRYVMHRGWQDHPFFEGDEYSRRDAWEWLVSEAAWKETRKRISGKMIVLKRGQLSHSIRFMANRWKWSKSRVERFISQLKNETMIETFGGTGQLLITICKYEIYQLKSGKIETEIGTPFEARPGQQRDKEEEGKEGKEVRTDDLGARAFEITDWCQRRLNAPWPYIASPVYAWLEWGVDLEKDVKPVVEKYITTRGDPPRSLAFLNDRIAASIRQRKTPMPAGGNYNAKPTSRHTGFADIDYHGQAENSGFDTN